MLRIEKPDFTEQVLRARTAEFWASLSATEKQELARFDETRTGKYFWNSLAQIAGEFRATFDKVKIGVFNAWPPSRVREIQAADPQKTDAKGAR